MGFLPVHHLSTRAYNGGYQFVNIVIAVVSVIAIASLGIIAWMIFVWMRKRGATTASVETSNSASSIEKDIEAYIEPGRGKMSMAKPEMVSTRSLKTLVVPGPMRSPPLVYTPPKTTLQPSPAFNPYLKVSSPNLLNDTNRDVPLESPARTASFQLPSVKPQLPFTKPSDKRLPRLMIVAATYLPSLSDELPIRVGETLRMIEEFEDEWCLVQHVGRANDQKGVCPRFCLIERQEIIPRRSKDISLAFPVSTYAK